MYRKILCVLVLMLFSTNIAVAGKGYPRNPTAIDNKIQFVMTHYTRFDPFSCETNAHFLYRYGTWGIDGGDYIHRADTFNRDLDPCRVKIGVLHPENYTKLVRIIDLDTGDTLTLVLYQFVEMQGYKLAYLRYNDTIIYEKIGPVRPQGQSWMQTVNYMYRVAKQAGY